MRPRFGDRVDDRRRGGYGSGGSYGGREDSYRYRGPERRYDDRRYDDRAGYDRSYDRYEREPRPAEDRAYDRGYREERGYDRRDRDDAYGRGERYASSGRNDRDRYGSTRGGGGSGSGYDRERYDRASDRDATRAREPASGPAYGESAPRSEAREPYGGSRYY